MPYTINLQIPEAPIREEWIWNTDIIRSYDGTEDFIPLNEYPRRVFSGTYEFESVQKARRHLALSFKTFQESFGLPLFQHTAKLKASAASGGATVQVETARSDFRLGRLALISESDKNELLTVLSFTASAVTFTTNLVNSYSDQAIICPVTTVFSGTGASFVRKNTDDSAAASFSYYESSPWAPNLEQYNASALTLFDSLPVVDLNSVGTEFEYNVDTGLIINDYIGIRDIFSPWSNSQLVFDRRWQCNRVFDNASWLLWLKLADYTKGSANPFLVPTFRSDFGIHTPAAGGGNQITLDGVEYSQHYSGVDSFSRIVVRSAAGRHYTKITSVTQISGRDRLTFSPALPAGPNWNVDQAIELLLKVRIADDKIIFDHEGVHSFITLTLRTID